MIALRFALRALRRDWHAGELRVLALALVVAVASVTAVGFVADRARLALQAQANELLAADLVVTAPEPLDPAFKQEAAARGLAQARTAALLSVVLAGDAAQLAEVKAVERGYPLRGQLRTAITPFGQEQIADQVPAPGQAWVEARLLTALGARLGDTLRVGERTLRIDRLVAYEPDRGGDLFSIAPRLLMNYRDLASTQLIQPGSRVRYNLLLAGTPAQIAAYRDGMAARLTPGVRLQSVRDARPQLRVALDRGERFLGLAALVSVVLSGLAIAAAARRYAQRHIDTAAILRCFGASRGLVQHGFLLQIALLGVIASLVGCALGYLAQHALARMLMSLMAANLPPPSWIPVAVGVAVGLVTLAGFALPPLSRLKDTPPMRALRRDLAPLPARALTVYAAATTGVAGLVLWQAGDLRLAAYTLGGIAATLGLLAGAAALALRWLQPLRARVGTAWRFGLASLVRRRAGSLVQLVAFGVGIMVMLLLSFVRSDLLADWRRSLPADAPNHFLINVQAAQRDGVQAFFRARDVAAPRFYPVVRGRLAGINDQRISPEDFQGRARRLVAREFNLSWSHTLATQNKIVAGSGWSDDAQPQFSVEQGLAERLGLKLGDTLTYRVMGQALEARITSIRAVDWDSFQVNFFVIASPSLLERFPAAYITSFYLPPQRKAMLADLVRQHPNLTVIDVDALMAKVRHLVDRISLAMQAVFGFTVLAGLVVLFAAVQASRDERLYESAMLRALGATRRQLVFGLLAEYMSLGLLAGTLGAAGASLTAYLLATQVFDLSYTLNLWLWLAGPALGAVGIGLAGLAGTYFVVRQSPMRSLRATG